MECYLNGVMISSGYITDLSDIICHADDFEIPQHMFQAALNSIYPNCEDQLAQARRKILGLPFRHPSHNCDLSDSDGEGDILKYPEATPGQTEAVHQT